jgi:hypothetical protein
LANNDLLNLEGQLARSRAPDPAGFWLGRRRPPEAGSRQNRALSPDVLRAMRMTLQTSSEHVHVTLTVALMAACAANLVLVCAWL